MGCALPEAGSPRGWSVEATWAGFDTDLAFTDGAEARLRQHAVSVSGTRAIGAGWSVRLATGATLGGEIDTGASRVTLGAGWQAAAQGARRWRDARSLAPALTTTFALAAGGAPLSDGGSLLATDARLGLVAGWAVGGAWRPYVSGQVFGGPVIRDGEDGRVRGSDVHHHRLSVGSVLQLPSGLLAFADVAPLGERGVAGGAGWAW